MPGQAWCLVGISISHQASQEEMRRHTFAWCEVEIILDCAQKIDCSRRVTCLFLLFSDAFITELVDILRVRADFRNCRREIIRSRPACCVAVIKGRSIGAESVQVRLVACGQWVESPCLRLKCLLQCLNVSLKAAVSTDHVFFQDSSAFQYPVH